MKHVIELMAGLGIIIWICLFCKSVANWDT